MTEQEKEILDATKEFAEIYDIPYDDRIESMILNAIREVVKNYPMADVMGMLPTFELSKVNRVEVIDENGRSYVNWKPTNKTTISMQDGGRTLKVFIHT